MTTTFNTAFAVFTKDGEMVHRLDFFRTARFRAVELGAGAYVMDQNGKIVFTA